MLQGDRIKDPMIISQKEYEKLRKTTLGSIVKMYVTMFKVFSWTVFLVLNAFVINWFAIYLGY